MDKKKAILGIITEIKNAVIIWLVISIIIILIHSSLFTYLGNPSIEGMSAVKIFLILSNIFFSQSFTILFIYIIAKLLYSIDLRKI